MKEIRNKAATEKREKMTQQGHGQRAAGTQPVPECYAELDFVDLESDLGKVTLGPNQTWAETLPQEEPGARLPEPMEIAPDSTEPGYIQTVDRLNLIDTCGEMKFLWECSPHLSSYITSIVLQDLRAGNHDTQAFLDRALRTSLEKGLPSLQLDAQKVLDTQSRTGRLVDHNETGHEVIFGCPTDHTTHTVTPIRIAQTKWNLWDYGDTLPTKTGDPMLDVYHPGEKERSKCLIVHLAAALLWAPSSEQQKPREELVLDEVYHLSRDLRYRQYLQAQECLLALGNQDEAEPLA